MATIRKRGPYQWQVIVKSKGQRTRSRTFSTRADAERWGRETRTAMDRGTFVDLVAARQTSVAAAITRYVHDVTPTKKSPDQERWRAAVLLQSPLATLSMAAVHSEDVARYRDARLRGARWRRGPRRGVPVSPTTVLHELALLSSLFETARKEWGLHVPNPVRDITKPRAARGRSRRLLDGEEQRIRAAAERGTAPWLDAYITLAMETTSRRGAGTRVLWKDVDLQGHTMTLRDTKAGGEDRVVPLSDVAADALRSLPHAGPRVFPVPVQKPSRAFHTAVLAARAEYEAECAAAQQEPRPEFLRDLRLHDLRHEGTSRLFEKGLDVMEAASVTGHKTLRMLQRYTHLRAQRIAQKLNAKS